MAMYAYKDIFRKEKLLARDARKQDKGIRFYCPNLRCDTHMHIRHKEGVSVAYFSAIPSHAHIKGCLHGSKNGFNPNSYNEEKFEFDNALAALTMPSKRQRKKEIPGEHGSGKVTLKPPHTLQQIYFMCKSYDCADTYNGITIGRMLLDNRSAYMYPKGVFGWKIIEGKCKRPHFYDAAKKKIFLTAATDEEKYTFILEFDDETLFKEIKNIVFPNRDYPIVVAGNWMSSGSFNMFCMSFFSDKQLKIVK